MRVELQICHTWPPSWVLNHADNIYWKMSLREWIWLSVISHLWQRKYGKSTTRDKPVSHSFSRILQVSHSSAQNSPDLTQFFPQLSRSHTALPRPLQTAHSFFPELSMSHRTLSRTLQVSHSSFQNSPGLTQFFPELFRSHTVLPKTLQISHSSFQNSSGLTQFCPQLSRSHTVFFRTL